MTKLFSQAPVQVPGMTGFYRGKVRDVYFLENNRLLMVASDRISAFDVVLPAAIPHKGEVLNRTAAYFLEATRDLVPNWWLGSPHPRVSYGYRAEPVPVEMVVRGYLSGHAWRCYREGARELCGVPLPEGLRESDPLDRPILTPTTKASEGHDQDISREQILEQGLVSEAHYQTMEQYALALFERGTQMARERGLILVDTKYEFGLLDGQILLMDEVHTPDSSRYFYADTYHELQAKGEAQQQLSKEFVRQWLIANGFQGLPGQAIPPMSTAWIQEISDRYQHLYRQITGQNLEASGSVQVALEPTDWVQDFLAFQEKMN
ncbi:MAG: phosphoribosylaminoimidazolesuccinocarboxamide synthase [Bacteroidia bacterium]